ncbi:MAG TPA: GNAT family N-acetyltransferase [Solirubrobacteraceae bacterium]|nr:GNAT family N-acetyltransferase [Solirubrobacteraceae bacterium]
MTTLSSLDRVETARLVCLRPTLDHAADTVALLCDPRVARTLSATGLPPSTEELSADLVARDAHWKRHGFGLWTVYDRAAGTMVGRGGLQHTSVSGDDEIEIGWAIVPERWGEGLATELALASVAAGFETLAVDELIAYTLPDNVASRRVMENAGFRYERELEHVGRPHVLYRRRRC